MVPMPGKRNQRTILSWSWFHLAKGQLLWPVFRTCGIRISSGTAKKKHKETRYWFPVYLYRESPYDLESKPFFSTANRSQSLHLGIFYQINMFFSYVSLFAVFPTTCPSKVLHVRAQRVFAHWTHPDIRIVLPKGSRQIQQQNRSCFPKIEGWPKTNTEKCGKTQLTSNMFHQFHAKQKPRPKKLEEFPT